MEWASRITAMGVGFAVPPVAGHYVDQWLGTGLVFLIVGMILGFGVGILQLTRIARDSSRGL